jgi:eukaryotic-like serine/threonine-protein kinase
MAASDTGRDLLFALLALQVGFIDQGQLVAAFRAWTRDKARLLADHLAERGDLDADQRGVVEAMVGVHLKKHGGSTEKSLAAVATGRWVREGLEALDHPEVEATLDWLGRASAADVTDGGRKSDRAATLSVGSATSGGQRFHVLRPHASGGLGVVYVALDREMHREVALKQIIDSHADDPVSRQRFLLEAEVTGGLEHPGIVPVYGLGTYAGGRPYYAMRFIRGDSLKEVIGRFHSEQVLKSNSSRRSLALRKLLRHFLDVCNAIDYAHSRGVLHRDIKPGNIILGKHGETLVVDWGLAKAQGRADAGVSDERPLVPNSPAGSTETMPGSALGTPGYMSPEQARGDLEQLGPRSDVYSLGATLYCLLTGKPPFEGNVNDVLLAVQKSAFQPPRSLVPSIDRALEAVCQKAMALDPLARYETPKALGEDVERWMADEPVAAFRESWTRTLARWLTRHRTGVTAVGAAMLVALAGLAAVLGVQARANGQLTAKNAELDAEFRREAEIRKEAENNFNMALTAVDEYLTSVSENTLFKIQDSLDIRKLRQELLNSALKFYKAFVVQRSHDPRLRRQLANAYFRVGKITQEVESPKQAIEAYRQAQTIWEPLVAAEPDDNELKGDVAASYLAVGKLQDVNANLDLDESTKSLARARAMLEPLAAANPLEPSYQSGLADCYSEIAIISARLGRSGESLVLLEKAKAIEQDLIKRYPDKHAYRKSLAEMTNVLGYAYHRLGKNDQALESFREVENICSNILKQVMVGPKPLWLMNLLALCHYNIGSIHKEKGELEDALKSFQQSLDYRTALVDAHSSIIGYKESLGLCCREIAMVQHDAHQEAAALQSIKRSINLFTPLVRAHPDHAGYHGQLGLSWNYLGCLHSDARNHTEALAAFEQAVAEQQLAVDNANKGNEYRGFLANHLDNLGDQFVCLGRVALGLPLHRRALGMYREISAAHPEDRIYALELLKSLVCLGTTERHNGDSTAALQSFVDAQTILERWSRARPGDAAMRILLGAVLDQEANTLFDQGLADQALERLERALVQLQLPPDQVTSDKMSVEERQSRRDVSYVMGSGPVAGDVGIETRRYRSEALWDRARVLRAKNRPAEALVADGDRLALWQTRPPAELVDVALKQLERAVVIGYGKTPVSIRASAVRQLELELACESVRLAISLGLKDPGKLRSHPDSSFILSREDIKLLIMDMVFPDRPFGDPREE